MPSPLFEPRYIRKEVTQALAMHTANATHADAVIFIPALTVDMAAFIITDGIAWGYGGSGTLSGGRLTVEDGAEGVVFDLDITQKGAGFVPLRKLFTAGEAVTITLHDGGADVTGYFNLLGCTWAR